MLISVTNQVRIQTQLEYWYTVENKYRDNVTGEDLTITEDFDGFTITLRELDAEGRECEIKHFCIAEKEEALAIADAIYKLCEGEQHQRIHRK